MELKNSEKLLIEAVSTIINQEGFAKVGINKVAKTAGCDKVLIYRYFGGLEGLIAAWAKSHDFYIQAYESFTEKIEMINSDNLKEMAKEILLAQLRFTRVNRMHQELLLWELSGNLKFNVVRELREENGHRLQELLDEKLGVQGDKIDMYITLLIAAINFVVLSTLKYPKFNGMDFSHEDSWGAFENALCDYIDMLFERITQ